MRTQEQIIAQLEARYAELEREANSAANKWPCETCRFREPRDRDGLFPWICANPLVLGFGHRRNAKVLGYDAAPALCGPEKALWEPRRSIWRRIFDRLAGVR